MAIRNTSAEISGLAISGGLPSITNLTVTGLFRHRQGNPSGDQVLIGARAGYSNYIYIQSNDYSGGAVIDLWTASDWQRLTATAFTADAWVAVGLSCSGVGSNQLRIITAESDSASPADVTQTLGGSSGTTTDIEFLVRTLFANLGSYLDVQNIKIGGGVLDAVQMRDEAWSLDVEYPGLWTPIHAPMTSGTLVAQAAPLTVVNSAGLSVVTGPLVPSGGGSSTLLSRRRSFQY